MAHSGSTSVPAAAGPFPLLVPTFTPTAIAPPTGLLHPQLATLQQVAHRIAVFHSPPHIAVWKQYCRRHNTNIANFLDSQTAGIEPVAKQTMESFHAAPTAKPSPKPKPKPKPKVKPPSGSPSSTSSSSSAPSSSVLCGLFEYDGRVWVLLTQRSSQLNNHAGETSFPGGRRDPTDPDDVFTALREAQEEVGLDPNHVQVWQLFDYVLDRRKKPVYPVVGAIPVPNFFATGMPHSKTYQHINPRPNTSSSTSTSTSSSPHVSIRATSTDKIPLHPIHDAIAQHLPVRVPPLSASASPLSVSSSPSPSPSPSPPATFKVRASPDEVAAVFCVPLDLFLSIGPPVHRTQHFSMDVLDDQGAIQQTSFTLHFFRYTTDVYLPTDVPLLHPAPPQQFIIFGLTASILMRVAAIAYQRNTAQTVYQTPTTEQQAKQAELARERARASSRGTSGTVSGTSNPTCARLDLIRPMSFPDALRSSL